MILIVSKSKKKADDYSEALLTMGYLAYGATPVSAIKEISPLYRAVVLLEGGEIINHGVFLSSFGAIPLKIPIFSIGETCDDRIALSLPENVSVGSLIKKITRHLAQKSLPIIGDYACAGFDAEVNLCDVFYFDRPLNLTKTEKLVFRYLSRTYPIPQSAESMIRHCFKASRRPEPSTVRAHISSINKKFKSLMGRAVIEHYENRGYLIITPQDKKRYFR